MSRKRVWWTFIVILILALAAGYVDIPGTPVLKAGGVSTDFNVHLGLDLQGGSSLMYEADVSSIDEADRPDALEGVRDVIERRVNAFGVSEPLVQTSHVGSSWRVIVELAGVFDIDKAIELIGETPLLVFKELKPQVEPTEEERTAADQANEEKRALAQSVLDRILVGEDFATLANEYTEDPSNIPTEGEPKGGDLGWAPDGAYVDAFNDVVFNQLASGEVYPELVQTQFGYHIIKLEEKRDSTDTNGDPVVEAYARHILFATEDVDAQDPYYAFNSDNFVDTDLTGQHLKSAAVAFDPNSGAPQVSMTFDSEGTDLFADITKRNIGNVVAIFLDGAPISQPTVQTEITNGEAIITGNFTLDEAKTLARRLNAGALPVAINLISQHNVGPSLGQISVERSLLAGAIGLALVALFMIVYYRLPGLLAVVALGIYSLVVLAIFKMWPVTLTLAGVAGFILSIGMAVDANVLIFERIREELRSGKSMTASIEDGFARAWLSIRDSNVSSLITTFILAWLGTSIVKGFAITLAIGILVSLFSAITVTRTFLRIILSERLRKWPFLMGVRS